MPGKIIKNNTDGMFSLICRNCLEAKVLWRWMSLLKRKEYFKYLFIRKWIASSYLCNVVRNTKKKKKKLFTDWKITCVWCFLLTEISQGLEHNYQQILESLISFSFLQLSALSHANMFLLSFTPDSDGQDEIQQYDQGNLWYSLPGGMYT